MREVLRNGVKHLVKELDLKPVNLEELVYIDSKPYLVKESKLKPVTKQPESGEVWKRNGGFPICVVKPFYNKDVWALLGLGDELEPFSDEPFTSGKCSTAKLVQWLAAQEYEFSHKITLNHKV